MEILMMLPLVGFCLVGAGVIAYVIKLRRENTPLSKGSSAHTAPHDFTDNAFTRSVEDAAVNPGGGFGAVDSNSVGSGSPGPGGLGPGGGGGGGGD